LQNRITGFLLVFISAVGFGSAPFFVRIAYQNGANIFEVLTARFLISWVLLLLYLQWKKPKRRLSSHERSAAILMGVCGYSVASLCYFTALERIPIPLASIVLYTYPTVVSLLMALWRIEKMDHIKSIALVITFIGLMLVLGSSFYFTDTLGLMLSLASSFLYSFYIIIGNSKLKEAPVTVTTMWVTWAAGTGIGLMGLAGGQISFQFGLNAWLATIFIAIFSTAITIIFFLQGVVLVGASRASIISTFESPVTVVLAAMFLAEVLTPIQLFGGILILASAILVNRSKQEPIQNKESLILFKQK
jgi:drug/metabolite transporter (DMT)-like permease